MEEKKEPKYLDMSAHSDINVTELLIRSMTPQKPPEEKEENPDEFHS